MKYRFGKYKAWRWYHRLFGLNEPKQNISCRVDYWDLWSLDMTFSNMIVPALKRFKQESKGVPLVDDEDLPERLHIPSEKQDSVLSGNTSDHELLEARWHHILDWMIWAFEQDLRDWADDYIHGSVDLNFGDDGSLQVEYSDGFHRDTEGMRHHEEQIQHGRKLFAKYYNHLWY